jgi:Tol biopolymer transport system component/predicted Ser/Thr protein kinase
MPLTPGTRLGPYEILAAIGAGGMGEVYRARDTRLDRIVAIKVARTTFSERFEREARAAAALNHPNLCQLYDVGPEFLVMEFVDGAPLVHVDGPRKLLDVAVQIADGLSAAHAAHLVHRDLKPDNILVTREGRVKILDFGLAKLTAPAADDATRTMGVTDPGTVLGTVNYMSPEQARGEPNLTPQSDQFSLGLVLYELAAGKRAFQRASAPETMAAIIRDEPEPLPADVPGPLRWVIERLLAKEPSERYDSTRDLYRDLKQIRDRLSEATSAADAAAIVAPERGRRTPVLAAGVIAGLLAGAGVAWLLVPAPAGPGLAKYKFTAVAEDDAEELAPHWSPDGKSLAYEVNVHGVRQVFTRVLGSDAAELTHAGQDCLIQFWSPDGAVLYYVSAGNLWSVPSAGGTAQTVLENVTGAALHPDGKTLAFVRGSTLWIGSLGGGDARKFWSGPLGGSTAGGSTLAFSPDGSKLAVGRPDALLVLSYPSGRARTLASGVPGEILGGASWFPDSRHLAVGGAPGPLVVLDTEDDSRRVIGVAPDAAFLAPSVSPDGHRIAYSAGKVEWDVLDVSMSTGVARPMVSGGGIAWWPDWAPSGSHFLFSIPEGSETGIEDRPAAGEGFSRKLFVGDLTASPRWSPDGTRFAFAEIGTDHGRTIGQLMIGNASSGQAVRINIKVSGASGLSWSPDGQWLAYIETIGGVASLTKIRAAPGATPQVLENAHVGPIRYQEPEWSPAGDWIAYPAADGIDLISPDGSSTRTLTSRKFLAYAFSKDGRQFYGIFQNTTGTGAEWELYAVNVASGAEKLLAPIALPASVNGLAGFSLHPDGTHFLTSVAKWPYDIWMLEGFDEPRAKSWLDRLLHR